MNKNKLNAYTIAELLIVILIIGFLSIFMLNSLTKATPDRHKALFKKAYSVTERTVQEIINDETLYPYNPSKLGFMNDCQVQIPSEADNTLTSAGSSGKKFITLFVDKLNVISKPDTITNPYEFVTTDGIKWSIPVKDFAKGSATGNGIKITVDVNGDKGLNEHATDLDNPNQDQFEIYVLFDGKLKVEGNVEKEFLISQDLKR